MYEKRLIQLEKEKLNPIIGDVFYNYNTKIYEKWNGKKWVNWISKEVSESMFYI